MKRVMLFSLICIIISLAMQPFPASATGALPVHSQALSVEQRITYQRALDAVTWQHTLFPSQSEKPSLAQVLPADVTKRKVEDSLRQSNALAELWSRPLTPEQLQAEMQRIAQQTRQPDLLREQWQILNNDASLIAEMQVRPLLADRLLRAWYARDERFHGTLKERAQGEVARYTTFTAMQQMSGEYLEIELALNAGSNTDGAVVALSQDEWNEEIDLLAQMFGTEPAALPMQRLSTLQEDDVRFYVTAVLAKSDERVRVALVQWHKVPFETWWGSVREQYAPGVAATSFDYSLPQIGATACANDCWSHLSFAPMARSGNVGVWTGTDLLIWGGVLFRPETGGRYNPATDSWHPIANANTPSWRTGHNLVWTGTELIVWGGWGGSYTDNVFNTGGRYNPLTDTWTSTSLTNAPTARSGATAVWTGSEMIIWGGGNAGFTQLNSGGRYNPSTNSWQATSLTGAPSPRSGHRSVWTGTEMIVWGGLSGSSEVSTGGRYNPALNSWVATNTTGTPAPRNAFSAVWTGTEMVVWGGTNNGGFTILNNGGRYNPATNTWRPMSTTSLLFPVFNHAAVWTGNLMIVFGGCLNHDCSSRTNAGARYDPASDSWMAMSMTNVPSARNSMTAVWTGTEMIVWGGCVSGECEIKTNTGGRYNPISNSWVATALPPVPFQRNPFVSVWTGTEMLVWGVDSQLLDTSIYRYRPATDSWARTVALNAPDARGAFSGVWTGTELIIWGGGVTGFGTSLTGGRFNPTTNTWTETSWTNAPTAREWHSAVWTGTEMIVWGGCLDGSCGATLNSGARYNPATNTWTAISTSGAPTGRYTHSAVWTGSEMIVWGGQPATNTGARYNPSTNTWTAITLSGAPSARWAHTGVWSGSEFIVWGGYNGTTTFNNGARYNPSTNSWSPIALTGAPSARWLFPSVWTGRELILWGGIVNNVWPFVSTNTGGRYNPATNTWTSTTLQSAPSARDLQQSVWTGSQMIIWGGTMDPDGANTNTGGMYWANAEGGGSPSLPTLASLLLSPTNVIGGQTSQGTVTLSSAAPAGGVVVALSSSNSAASVPASVIVPEGAISANFTVSTTSVTSATSVTIGASYNNSNVIATLWIGASPSTPTLTSTSTSKSTSTPTPATLPTSTPTPALTSTPASLPVLSSFTLNPASVGGGLTSTGTVTLSAPAPSGGTVITLVSSTGVVASVPPSVTVAAGTTSASFTVTTTPVSVSATVNISATYAGLTKTATLTVTPLVTADTVAITLADYRLSSKRLSVQATSTNATATLKVYVTATGQLIGTLTNNGGIYSGQFKWPTNPQNITVRSSLGGLSSAIVIAR